MGQVDTNNNLLKSIGFTRIYFVQGRNSIADLFTPEQRCGIYILHFADGNYYVGQAVDVTRRYVHHRMNYPDIEKISFKQVNRHNLNQVEQETIGILEAHNLRLRNITFASVVQGQTDFDLVMNESGQEKWLSTMDFVDNTGDRPVDPELRYRYRKRFERFLREEHAASVIAVMREYIQRGIPAFKRGEISFWSCSCLPGDWKPRKRSKKSLISRIISWLPESIRYLIAPDLVIYSRVNINWQEVFTASIDGKDLKFSLHCARSPLEKTFGKSLSGLKKRHPKAIVVDHQYQPGGQDQVDVGFFSEAASVNFLKDSETLQAIRLFNLRLMRKGLGPYNRYHCLDLADRLIEE